jgi:hypothetical protein
MERGLFWLPLLAVFIGLAWAGWNEYQKLEAYRFWAQQFQKTKYDIYAVLGINEDRITWGKPTRKGTENIQTFSLKNVQNIRVIVNGVSVDLEKPPSTGGVIAVEFFFFDNSTTVRIPFTQISLAAEWGKYLQQQLQVFHS